MLGNRLLCIQRKKTVQVSGWMKALARAMKSQLEEEGRTLLKRTNQSLNENQVAFSLGKKLDGLANVREQPRPSTILSTPPKLTPSSSILREQH